MSSAAFLGSALPYAIIIGMSSAAFVGLWLFFNKFQPWYHKVFVPWRNRRRERKAWDIHAR